MSHAYVDPAPPGRERTLRLDASLESATFESLMRDRVDGQDRAADAVSQWVEAAAVVGPGGEDAPPFGIALVGDTGTGKTHILSAAARALSARLPPGFASNGYRVILAGEAQFHAYARACWSRGEPFPDRLRRAISGANRSWLFLDDLGVSSSDPRWCEEMADLLVLRHASPFRTLTVVTTNIALPALEVSYGARTASRLREDLLRCQIVGADQRRPRRAASN